MAVNLRKMKSIVFLKYVKALQYKSISSKKEQVSEGAFYYLKSGRANPGGWMVEGKVRFAIAGSLLDNTPCLFTFQHQWESQWVLFKGNYADLHIHVFGQSPDSDCFPGRKIIRKVFSIYLVYYGEQAHIR